MTINQFDNGITKYVQGWSPILQPIMVAATYIGLPAVVIVVAIVGTIMAWRVEFQRVSIALLASLAGLGINTLIKHFLHRTRPDTLYVTGMQIKSFSFPSGHSFGAAATYGLLAYLAYKYLPDPWNSIVAIVLVVLILLIGLSRVYLGAHYPTDVMGGWLLGSLTLGLIIWLINP